MQTTGSGRHLAPFQTAARQRRQRGNSRCRVVARAIEHVTNEQLKQARLITALKTPYLENGKFDLPTFDTIVEHQVPAFTDHVFVVTLPVVVSPSLSNPRLDAFVCIMGITHA